MFQKSGVCLWAFENLGTSIPIMLSAISCLSLSKRVALTDLGFSSLSLAVIESRSFSSTRSPHHSPIQDRHRGHEQTNSWGFSSSPFLVSADLHAESPFAYTSVTARFVRGCHSLHRKCIFGLQVSTPAGMSSASHRMGECVFHLIRRYLTQIT